MSINDNHSSHGQKSERTPHFFYFASKKVNKNSDLFIVHSYIEIHWIRHSSCFPCFFLESLFLFLEPRELLVKITLKNYKHYKKVLEAKHKEINTNFLNTNLTGHFSISLTPRHSNVFINNLKSLKVPFCTNFVLRFLFCV